MFDRRSTNTSWLLQNQAPAVLGSNQGARVTSHHSPGRIDCGSLAGLPAFLAWLLIASVVLPSAAETVHADEPAVAVQTASADPRVVVPDLIIIRGDASTRGETYGRLFRDEIRDFFDKEIIAPFVGQHFTREQMTDYAAACGRVVVAECPLIAAELAGIARGAELSFEDIMLLQLHEELYHRVPLPAGSPPKEGHCTAIAVGPSESGDGQTYVGQTWDWMQSVAGKSRIIEWQRDDGVSVLAYGFPGLPFGAGINSEGVAHTWTSAALGDRDQSPRVGLPSYVLIAHLLSQPNLDAVIAAAERDRHAGWFTFVMADRDGRLINIEGSPTGVTIEHVDGRLARVGYGSRVMRHRPSGEPAAVHPRGQLMEELLSSHSGHNNRAQLQTFFTDPVCQIQVGPHTIDLLLFNCTQRTAALSRGPHYGVAWREFSFSPPMDTTAAVGK